jgi:translation initiation factor RLI1
LAEETKKDIEEARVKRLPKPVVVMDYQRCQVEECELGVCLASLKCPRNILRQETPFEMPDIYPGLCRGCGLCTPACPFGAIQIR